MTNAEGAGKLSREQIESCRYRCRPNPNPHVDFIATDEEKAFIVKLCDMALASLTPTRLEALEKVAEAARELVEAQRMAFFGDFSCQEPEFMKNLEEKYEVARVTLASLPTPAKPEEGAKVCPECKGDGSWERPFMGGCNNEKNHGTGEAPRTIPREKVSEFLHGLVAEKDRQRAARRKAEADDSGTGEVKQ